MVELVLAWLIGFVPITIILVLKIRKIQSQNKVLRAGIKRIKLLTQGLERDGNG